MVTKQQLQEEIRCKQVTEEEREISNKLYAIKLVEKIVFGFIYLLLVAAAAAWIRLIIIK